MPGGYLRTNYTRTGKNSANAIGGGFPKTSYAGGPGLNIPYGGFIMGSLSVNNVSFGSVCAHSALSAWYGGGVYDSGYYIRVIAVNVRFLNTSANLASGAGRIYASHTTTGSAVMFYGAGSAAAASSTISCTLEWTGFITSVP